MTGRFQGISETQECRSLSYRRISLVVILICFASFTLTKSDDIRAGKSVNDMERWVAYIAPADTCRLNRSKQFLQPEELYEARGRLAGAEKRVAKLQGKIKTADWSIDRHQRQLKTQYDRLRDASRSVKPFQYLRYLHGYFRSKLSIAQHMLAIGHWQGALLLAQDRLEFSVRRFQDVVRSTEQKSLKSESEEFILSVLCVDHRVRGE